MELDRGTGAIHESGMSACGGIDSTELRGGPTWPGWDIARDVAVTADGSWGVTVDGYGGLHVFGTPTIDRNVLARDAAYWPGWDIARAVVLEPDGTGGWVFDAWGGIHPFGNARTLYTTNFAVGVPGVNMPAGWDAIPGARGCTPQSCSYRDDYSAFQAQGEDVYGVSTQSTEAQTEFAEREHIPFPLLSDPEERVSFLGAGCGRRRGC